MAAGSPIRISRRQPASFAGSGRAQTDTARLRRQHRREFDAAHPRPEFPPGFGPRRRQPPLADVSSAADPATESGGPANHRAASSAARTWIEVTGARTSPETNHRSQLVPGAEIRLCLDTRQPSRGQPATLSLHAWSGTRLASAFHVKRRGATPASARRRRPHAPETEPPGDRQGLLGQAEQPP